MAMEVDHVHADSDRRRHVLARKFGRRDHPVARPVAPADRGKEKHTATVQEKLRVLPDAAPFGGAEAEARLGPVDNLAAIAAKRDAHVVEVCVADVPETHAVRLRGEIDHYGPSRRNLDLAEALLVYCLRVRGRLAAHPVLNYLCKDVDRAAGLERAAQLDGHVDVPRIGLRLHENVFDAYRVGRHKVDRAKYAAKAVGQRKEVLAPSREGIVAPAELAVWIGDPDGKFVLAAVADEISDVHLERRLKHEFVRREPSVHKDLGAVAHTFAERQHDTPPLHRRRHGEAATPPADAPVVARRAVALLVTGDSVKEVSLDRAWNGHVNRKRLVLPGTLGLGPRNGSGKQRIPPACRRGDLQSLDGDWLEPVAATFAYLRRVDGVDVQDIVLPCRVAVEPKPPAVAGEGNFRALRGECIQRRRTNGHCEGKTRD